MSIEKATWFWGRRENRWDVYPQLEPLVRLLVVPVAPGFVDIFHENGAKTRTGYILDRECPAPFAWRARAAAAFARFPITIGGGL